MNINFIVPKLVRYNQIAIKDEVKPFTEIY